MARGKQKLGSPVASGLDCGHDAGHQLQILTGEWGKLVDIRHEQGRDGRD